MIKVTQARDKEKIWPCSPWVLIAQRKERTPSVQEVMSLIPVRNSLRCFLCPMLVSCWPVHFYKFYYNHFEIIGYPCNVIGSQRCDLFPNRTIFCSKSHLFSWPMRMAQNNKTTNQISRLFLNLPITLQENERQKSLFSNFGNFCCQSLIKSFNWTSGRAILVWNHTCDFKTNSCCCMISDQIALHSVQLPLLITMRKLHHLYWISLTINCYLAFDKCIQQKLSTVHECVWLLHVQ